MKYKRLFGWLTLDMLIFVVVNVLLIYHFNDRFFVLGGMSFFTLLVLGLGVFRAAHIVSNEVVTKPLREPFVEEHKEKGKIVEEPKKSGFLGAMGLLIYCPSCTGVWLAAVCIYSYVFWPQPTFLVALLFALSGVERIATALVGYLKK